MHSCNIGDHSITGALIMFTDRHWLTYIVNKKELCQEPLRQFFYAYKFD